MMRKLLLFVLPLFLLIGVTTTSFAQDHEEEITTEHVEEDDYSDSHDATAHEDANEHGHHADLAEPWAVVPFVLLLLMIATGPLFFAHFWHKNYPVVAVTLGALVIGYYIFALQNGDSVIHTLAEYIQFIALLAALFMASGGILIKVDKASKPMTNMMILIIGALLANLIGTTGASMLLIRPFIRLNKDRVKAYHIMFFIFMVSNVGGSLTPIGDPPLFLGFLKGVPFEWTLSHNVVPWAFAITLLAIIFFIFDSRNKADEDGSETEPSYTGKITIKGSKNFVWILLIIACVFIDPNVFPSVPGIDAYLHGQWVKISFLREVLMLSIASLSYFFADKEALKGNEFEFEPIKEVAFIFIGIFFTMMPALELVGNFAKANPELITTNTLYWLTGSLSGVLDNAPTYVNFLTATISADGGSVAVMGDVQAYSGLFHTPGVVNAAGVASEHFTNGEEFMLSGPQGAIVKLTAISVASVFFGAMTYIGNAPNFMVKSIAEQVGVKMPSFFSYITKYSLVILLPILILVWLIFFQLDFIESVVPQP